MFAARRAGTRRAANDTPPNNNVTKAKVAGSDAAHRKKQARYHSRESKHTQDTQCQFHQDRLQSVCSAINRYTEN